MTTDASFTDLTKNVLNSERGKAGKIESYIHHTEKGKGTPYYGQWASLLWNWELNCDEDITEIAFSFVRTKLLSP